MLGSLVALLTLGTAILDGEDAMNRASRLLKDLGVRGEFQIQTLTLTKWDRYANVWWVGYSTPNGPVTVELDPATGKARHIEGPPKPESKSVDNRKPNPRHDPRLMAILTRLGYSRSVRIGAFNIGWIGGGSNGADFAVLVHGLQFFNLNPTYAHSLTLNPVNGAIRSFRASPDPPAVNAWKPVVPAAIALKKLKSWGHTRAVAKGLPKEVDPSEGDLRPELGYWKFSSDSKARLVWRASKYTYVEGRLYGLGALRMFVDALDGTLREPDDPGWGMNP